MLLYCIDSVRLFQALYVGKPDMAQTDMVRHGHISAMMHTALCRAPKVFMSQVDLPGSLAGLEQNVRGWLSAPGERRGASQLLEQQQGHRLDEPWWQGLFVVWPFPESTHFI